MDRWCEFRQIPRGEVISVPQCWELAKLRYNDRLDLDWRPKTTEELEAIFDTVGLRGPFWSLRA